MAETRLSIVVDAEDKASSTLQKISGKVKDMEPTFKKMAVAGTAAFGVISAVGISALKEFTDSQKTAAIASKALGNTLEYMSEESIEGLEKSLKGSGTAFEKVSAQMQEAGKAALKLGFDDDEARLAFAKLFQVTEDVTQAQSDLKLAMNLSAFSGKSLEASVDAVTKVHAGGTRILKEFGIEVKEGTTAMEALQIASTKVGGAARVMSETLAGQMAVMQQQFANIKESIGAALAPALQSLLTYLAPIIEKITEWAEKNPELLGKILLVSAAIAALVAGIGIFGLAIPAIITGITALGTALLFLTANPIGLTITALAALVAAGVYVYKNWETLKKNLALIWEGIKIIFKNAIDTIMGWLEPLFKAVDKVKSTASNITSGVKSFGSNVVGSVKGLFGINDGIVQNGRVITTHPDDFIVATKNPSTLGGGQTINFVFNEVVAGDDGIKRIIQSTIEKLNRNSTLRVAAGQ